MHLAMPCCPGHAASAHAACLPGSSQLLYNPDALFARTFSRHRLLLCASSCLAIRPGHSCQGEVRMFCWPVLRQRRLWSGTVAARSTTEGDGIVCVQGSI